MTAEIEDLLLRDSQVGGAYKQVGVNYDGIILLSKIDEAIKLIPKTNPAL